MTLSRHSAIGAGGANAAGARIAAENLERNQPKAQVSVCPGSYNNRHHWMIDQANHGVCIWCDCERDFPTRYV